MSEALPGAVGVPAGRGGREEAKGAAAGADAGAIPESGAAAKEQRAAPRKRVAWGYTPSERARAPERAVEVGVTRVARELGMSRFSLQEWRRKMRLHAEGKLKQSPVTGSVDSLFLLQVCQWGRWRDDPSPRLETED